jgi:hypothetical protein
MKPTLALVCLLVLTACTTPLKPSVEIPKPDTVVILNCPDLIAFEEGQEVTMGDLLLKLVEVSGQYYLCQASAIKNYEPSKLREK